MKRRHLKWGILCTLFGALAFASTASAADRVMRRDGAGVLGEVIATSAAEVAVRLSNGSNRKVPVNEIESIAYDNEPLPLRSVRTAVRNGNYSGALELLDKLEGETIDRNVIKQDIAFFRALTTARLALAGDGDIRQAGSTMRSFVSTHVDSYHAYEAQELLGDLFVAVGAYDQANAVYGRLAEAPWPEAKTRSAVAIGRTMLAQENYEEALGAFDRAIAAVEDSDPNAADIRAGAQLGKALCLAATGEPDEGVRIVEGVIRATDAEQIDLQARAYLTLGKCHRHRPDAAKDALLAFLHVDVLYFTNPEAHAEALANLKELWNETGNPERSLQAAQLLEERYGGSRWAKQ